MQLTPHIQILKNYGFMTLFEFFFVRFLLSKKPRRSVLEICDVQEERKKKERYAKRRSSAVSGLIVNLFDVRTISGFFFFFVF